MTETQKIDRAQAIDALRRIAHMATLSGWRVGQYYIGGHPEGVEPQITLHHPDGHAYAVTHTGGGVLCVEWQADFQTWEVVHYFPSNDPEGALLAAYRDAIRRYAETYGTERP